MRCTPLITMIAASACWPVLVAAQEPEAVPATEVSPEPTTEAVEAAEAAEPATTGVGLEATQADAFAAPAPLPEEAALPEVAPRGPELKIYGHGRVDLAYSTTRMQHYQFGFWGRSPDPDGPTPTGDSPEFTVYPRWSRFGANWDAGDLGDPDVSVKAKIEIDFHGGGGSESRPLPRMRHAYGEFKVGDFSVLGGQTWDLVAPLITGGMENAIFWYGGNLGDRRPQLRLTYAPQLGDSTLVFAGALGQSGAVDNEDLDHDGMNDGVAWGYPAVQGLVELQTPLAEGKKLRLGVSSHYGGKRMALRDGDENFKVTAAVGHLELPISIFTLRMEAWWGKNVNDLRGGIGQGLILTDNNQDGIPEYGHRVESRGGWAHVQADPVNWYSLQVGAGLDDPPNRQMNVQRTRNITFYIAQGFKPWKPVTLGYTYTLYKTAYRDFNDANVHRLTAYSMVSF